MKIAIIHDYIKEYGGAERVLEELSALYPDAPIYTSIYAPEFLGSHHWNFKKMKIHTSFLNLIPFREKLISPLRLLSPFAFMSFDLSKYDVIIVSQTGAYFPNLVRKGKGKVIAYTHTPPRYLYGYKTAREWKNNPFFLVIGEIANHFLRMVDYHASKNVDYFIANSEEVASRIEKFYRRDSVVINPPIDVQTAVRSAKKEYFYLTGGRLARAKGIDVIIEAFNKNKKKLKIFGKGFAGFEDELRTKAKENIEFVGEVSDVEKMNLMAGAKAFVFASFDEDFGITPVESMSVGTPVIAYKSGGVKETVADNVTGLFYQPNTSDAINSAINKFEKMKFDEKTIVNQANEFASKNFDTKIRSFISKIV